MCAMNQSARNNNALCSYVESSGIFACSLESIQNSQFSGELSRNANEPFVGDGQCDPFTDRKGRSCFHRRLSVHGVGVGVCG